MKTKNKTSKIVDMNEEIDWPESTEERSLLVTLTDDERIEEGKKLVELLIEEDRLVAEKSAVGKEYSAKIEREHEKISAKRTVVATGQDKAVVLCHWVFECGGVSDTAQKKYHAYYKTLFRNDTGEAVETIGITAEDRQRNLPLGEADQVADKIAELKELGYEVKELEEDSDSAFGLFRIDTGRMIAQLNGDTLAEAVRRAFSLSAEELVSEQEAESAA